MKENEKWFLISNKQLATIYAFINNLVIKVGDALPACDVIKEVAMNKFDLEEHFNIKKEIEMLRKVTELDKEAIEKFSQISK